MAHVSKNSELNTTVIPKIASSDKYVLQHKNIINRLPQQIEQWNLHSSHSGHKNNSEHHVANSLQNALTTPWLWPTKSLFFIGDPHADAEAFVASLVATGGIKKTGPGALDFKLTNNGKKSIFIIGGDCLDKGPSNLKLLKSVRKLMDLGAKVKLIAGNHDLRLFMGIHAIGLKRDTKTEHLFVRMGDKVIPLLKEVYDMYLDGKKISKSIPDEAECKRRLFPSDSWFADFPVSAEGVMTKAGIERELQKMRKKYDQFEQACLKAGFTMRDVYATALKCRELFLYRKGEFAWFYQEMQLAYRSGSFLFIHAGLDDEISDQIKQKGIRYLNQQFQEQIKSDLFGFYYGSLANTMRTKYRPADLPLSDKGVNAINSDGLYVIVHGHINRKYGQRIVLKQNLIHVESDITMDRNSRKKEGLKDIGFGVTIIHPSKYIVGISTDYPYAKVFSPEQYLSHNETTSC